jgi:hypothetical protein
VIFDVNSGPWFLDSCDVRGANAICIEVSSQGHLTAQDCLIGGTAREVSHVCVWVWVWVWVWVGGREGGCGWVGVCVGGWVGVRMCVCVGGYVWMCVCVRTRVCVRVFSYTHTHTHTHNT